MDSAHLSLKHMAVYGISVCFRKSNLFTREIFEGMISVVVKEIRTSVFGTLHILMYQPSYAAG
jgi:hypothetical protein